MKIRYRFALSKDSKSVHHTSGSTEQELNFYVDTIGYYRAYEGYYTEREGMDTYLLFYTVSGQGYLKYGGEEYRLTKGTAAIIQCREHQFYRTDSKEWEFYYIHFCGSSADKYYRMLKEEGAAFLKISNAVQFMELLKNLERWAGESGIISDIRIANSMENLFTELLVDRMNPWKEESLLAHRKAIQEIQQYIKEHYQEPITVDEMAERSSMSKYYFMRIFKKVVGMPPHEYLKCCRINESKRLLKETTYPVSQIADLTGYGNVNIYIQNFKQCVGITPLKYRKNAF